MANKYRRTVDTDQQALNGSAYRPFGFERQSKELISGNGEAVVVVVVAAAVLVVVVVAAVVVVDVVSPVQACISCLSWQLNSFGSADLSDQDKGRRVVVCSRKVAGSTGLAWVWSLNDVRLLYIWQYFPMVRSCRSVEHRRDYLDRDVLLHSSSCDRCSNRTDFLIYSVLRRARSLASISFRFHCKLLHQHKCELWACC
ncbi:conserved hypothetical protein [Trichinella spiralis]|uniref:Uncharacterized protein n=1 Tax=Trichinella spiralis TaxID=6334 RepID=E5SI24_TRISP|nr:conserved hypothetical protein [Trichinella spiralis]KRY39321.1 hypothetical protein T01_1792 [Trichinella spiralis]